MQHREKEDKSGNEGNRWLAKISESGKPFIMKSEKRLFWPIMGGIMLLAALAAVRFVLFHKGLSISIQPLPTNTQYPTATLTPGPTKTQIPTLQSTITITPSPLETITPTVIQPTYVAITPTSGVGSQMASPVDGMVMVYVPAGEFIMGSDIEAQIYNDQLSEHMVYLDAYWIDKTEVTNAMFAQCVIAGVCDSLHYPSSSTHDDYYENSQYANYPVIYVTAYEAITYCEWAGRHLPNEAEWEKAARGTDSRTYPWGDQAPSSDLLNYSGNVGDTTAVGSYPAGASPYGALDMAGNAWEWVDDWFYANPSSEISFASVFGNYHVFRGGDWSNDVQYVTVYRRSGDSLWGTFSNTGFRCALSAVSSENNPEPRPTLLFAPSQPSAYQPEMAPIPQIGSTQVSPADGMVLVYVPEGEFLMGSTDADTLADADEFPQHLVCLDAYWIDQTEITNAMYEKCVQADVCADIYHKNSYTHASYFGNAQYADYPVINVDWSMAQSYCQWVGRRLPSEAEWEKAARGEYANLYPWGNDQPAENLLNGYGWIGDTTMVGSYPDGASLYGALDMAGNVWEWVNDWYDVSYYTSSPLENPSGSIFSSGWHVLRGGSWEENGDTLRAANRYVETFQTQNNYIGFRCAAQHLRGIPTNQ
jgi:formylglycine-generating enzyme required for sulfatase activity